MERVTWNTDPYRIHLRNMSRGQFVLLTKQKLSIEGREGVSKGVKSVFHAMEVVSIYEPFVYSAFDVACNSRVGNCLCCTDS